MESGPGAAQLLLDPEGVSGVIQESQTVEATVEIPLPPETVVQQVLGIVQAHPSGPADASRADLSMDGGMSVVNVVRSHISSGTFYATCALAALAGLLGGIGVAQGFQIAFVVLGIMFGIGAFGSVVMFKGSEGAKISVAGNPERSFVSIDGSIDPGLLQSLNMALATPYGVSLLGA